MQRALGLVLGCLVAWVLARSLGADEEKPAPAPASTPPAATTLTDLSDDAHELRAAFNAANGRVRLLLLVSPG